MSILKQNKEKTDQGSILYPLRKLLTLKQTQRAMGAVASPHPQTRIPKKIDSAFV